MLFTFCLAFLSHFGFAQTLNNGIGVFAASEMRYECIGDNKYRIFLDVYAECGYFDGSLNNKDNYPVTIKSVSLNKQFEGVLIKPNSSVLRNGTEITIYCADEDSQCDTRDENSPRGLKKYSFSGDVDLKPWGQAADWKVFWARNNRSEEITTISGRQPSHVEVNINNLTTCNSSPKFGETANPVSSIITVCKGAQGKVVPLNAIDVEGNNLRYSIVSPLKGVSDPLIYGGGFSATKPLGGNSSVTVSNGSLVIKSEIPEAELNGTFDLLVEEVDGGGNSIGSIRKGFQVTSLTCDNEKPTITGFDSTEVTELTFCAGEAIDLTIYGNDGDGDAMRFISNPTFIKSNPSASNPAFTKNTNDNNPNAKYSATPEGYIKWTPALKDTGKFTFNISLEDNACPVQENNSKEFIININPQPVFELGNDIPYDCKPFPLNSNVSSQNTGLIYEWRRMFVFDDTLRYTNIESTDPFYEVDEPVRLHLKVADAAGCFRLDSIDVYTTLAADFDYRRWCVDQTTEFNDTSYVRSSIITSYEWIIDGVPYSGKTVNHSFPSVGKYPVKYTVTNDLGCVDEVNRTIDIVPTPVVSMSFDGFCSSGDNYFGDVDGADGVDLVDETSYNSPDGPGNVAWTIKGISDTSFSETVNSSGSFMNYHFPDSGLYQVQQYVVSAAECEGEAFDTVQIYQRPLLNIIGEDTLYLNCNTPDTVFKGVIDSYFTGLESYTFQKYRRFDSIPFLRQFAPTSTIATASDTFRLEVDTIGEYYFRVVDSRGCDYYQQVAVLDPVQADFSYGLICSEGDVNFLDRSVSGNGERAITEWVWDFGDGNSSSVRNPSHRYSKQNDYEVKLSVKDATGCEKHDTLTVFYTFPKEAIKIDPDPSFLKQCVDDTIFAYNYKLTLGIPYHIDSIRWVFNDSVIKYQDFPIDPLQINKGLEQRYIFTVPILALEIKSNIFYNYNPYNYIESDTIACKDSISLSKSFEIYPRFHGDILDNRVCIGDSGIFKFIRDEETRQIPIVSAYWEFYSAKEQRVIETSTEVEPQVFVNNDLVNRGASQLRVEVSLLDINGCDFNDVAIIEVDEITAKPRWNFDHEVCLGSPELFIVESDQGDIDNWQIAQNYTEVRDEGVFIAPTLENPVVGRSTISFDSAGTYPVSVYLIKNVSIELQKDGERKVCRSRLDDSITVYDVPDYEIDWDTVCSSFPVVFENLSTIDPEFGTVLNYTWDFGDGTILVTAGDQKTVSHQYQYGGFYSVRLSATTSEGCNDSYKVFDGVYVRPTPEIGFITDLELEAGYPITFTDNSETYGADIVTSSWDFGDLGKFENDLSVTVQWDTVGIYFIKHAIETEEGCIGYEDSLRIDLNTYLELPTAFTPNGDGTNDSVGLISKSIRELYTFKIFNRWGQVVFDAEGDVTARWDGTFNGTPQEVGVYVVHVHALGAYETEFNYKTNLKLIR